MSQSMKYVLITGTNSGLGLGVCTRLLDDFLTQEPPSSSLTLIFTTRSSRKGSETLRILQSHLENRHSAISRARIHFQSENVDLTNLLTVRTLARKLVASNIPYLDAVILNAGIGGWTGINWLQAIPDVLRNLVTNTTWPRFKLGTVGAITEKQLTNSSDKSKLRENDEPPLGQIFCANVFGHYMLAHWLVPILSACNPSNPGRIIWVSSIEARPKHFHTGDLMGLKTDAPYESSKRLTDILGLSYTSDAAKRAVSGFLAIDDSTSTGKRVTRATKSTPTMHVGHPGVCSTSVITIPWFMQLLWDGVIQVVRLVGSPWTTISPYLAALVFTWLVIASTEEIDAKEAEYGERKGGRVKWGTAASRSGTATVRPTECEGWGLNGSGQAYTSSWWGGGVGRAPGAVDAKAEDVDEFVAVGAEVWRDMEVLRREWEARLEEFDRSQI